MNIPPLGRPEPTFGFYKYQKVLNDGKCVNLYNSVDRTGVKYSLIYINDRFGRWIKSKLKCFKGNKLIKTIFSENKYKD